ncbi:MAG TPA: hypothetical protein VMU81_21540 [Acetobacteraceae bacterium]|nr:hypothetical protein [Acetobacteraceae bacterium]
MIVQSGGTGIIAIRQLTGEPRILALIECGVSVRMTSNFAREFTKTELEVLACMQSIAISIDTSDRGLLRAVRRHVDLRQIATNIALVKAMALKLHRADPQRLCGI